MLIEDNLRFQADVLANVRDGVIAADLDGLVVYWNEGAVQILGYTAEEALGRHLSFIYPNASRSDADRDLQEILEGRSQFGEWLGIRKDGTEVWLDAKVSPMRGRDGEPIGFVGVSKDVTRRRESEERLRALNETLKALVEASPLAIVATDSESRVTLWSPAAERTFGWKAEEVLGQRLPIVPEDRWDEHLAFRRRLLDGERFTGIETRRRDRSGATIDLRISAAPLHGPDGRVQGAAELFEDINDRKRAERAIRRLASVPEQSPDPLVELDLAGNALYVNQAARSRFPDLQALGSWHPVLANVAAILPRFRYGETKSFSFEVNHNDLIYHQMVYYMQDSALVRVFFHDVTEQRRAKELLEREVLHDRLTELPNRTLFLRRLDEQIRSRDTTPFSVLSLNLDRFKIINDSLGQMAGDQLLAGVGQRIAACLTPDDIAARLGSDEFAILLRGRHGAADSVRAAGNLREALSLPVEICGQEIFPSVSIGVASGEGYDSGESLLRDAHIAMYRAKSLGGGRYELFERTLGNRSLDRLRLENELRRAIERGGLRLHYQPIVRLKDGVVVAFEALLRWPRPERGMVPPAELIPIAEEAGLIQPLTYWALSQVCQRLCDWRRPEGSLAIHLNLSSRVLSDPTFVSRIQAALAETPGDGGPLVLEITESTLMEDLDSTRETLARLKALGVGIAIDDFGTGYSSLSYLQRFPIDSLKIDRSFVATLGERGENPEILRAIVTLARSLGMEVIAEGVETREQLSHLLALGCGLAQGFLFSRPVEREIARNLLTEAPSWAGLLTQPRNRRPASDLGGHSKVTPLRRSTSP